MALHYSLYGVSDDEDDPRPGSVYEEDDEPRAIEEIVEGEIEPFNDADTAAEGDDLEGLFGDPNAPVADAEKKEVKEKKVRKQRDMPKMNGERLRGPLGLIAVDELFEDFKMQGRGHELDDLNQILKRFQTWTHRMYPRFAFPDCIEQIERLGRKKDIKGYMLRNRNQRLQPDVVPVRQLDDDDEDEAAVDNPAPMRMDDDDPAPERSDDDDPAPELSDDDEPAPKRLHVEEPQPALTADVLERMRLNREAALARRNEKMRQREAGEMATSIVSVSDNGALGSASPSEHGNATSNVSVLDNGALSPASPSEHGNEISEDSLQVETPMEVDQPSDEAVQAPTPVASQDSDDSDRSLSR